VAQSSPDRPEEPATVATGAGPFAIVLTPAGKSAYVTNSNANTVSQYTIDPRPGRSPSARPRSRPAKVRLGSLLARWSSPAYSYR